jgi:hypothetical protein
MEDGDNITFQEINMNNEDSITIGGKKNSELIIDDKLYKTLLINHDPNGPNIMKAIDIVKKYIIREKLIIVGGMAIDFALRLRGSKLYTDEEIPDYDINTPHHWIDAYEMVQWLNRLGMRNLDVINAFHPTTVKVRVMSTVVADVTYVPENIYKNIPRLNYHGFDFVHPFYQYIDQHRSLSYGYENIDMDRPVLKSRWTKDMKRHDLLWAKYPLKYDGERNMGLQDEQTISVNLLNNQCLGGFAALLYWVDWAKKHGFKPTYNVGNIMISSNEIKFRCPEKHASIYSNDIKELYNKINKEFKIKSEIFYERFLDKLPKRVMMDQFELLDNKNMWIAAHKLDKYHIINLQPIMLQLLVNYLFVEKKYAYYAGYMLCHDLLKFGAENMLPELLPTAEYYGINNETDTYMLAKLKFMSKNSAEKIDIPKQPHNVYDHHLRTRKVPEIYFKFNPKESELFKMDGLETKKFI